MNTRDRRSSYVIWAALLVTLLFLLIRAPYGWCFNDEPFIITLAQRLYKGDHLILDEWHPAQVFGPVILPFYYVFRLFSPDNTGILLVFRYTYCFLWWSTCLIVFLVIKKHMQSVRVAFCVFVYLAMFSPLDYMTISYTSIGLMCCLILSCLLVEIRDIPQKKYIAFSAAFSLGAVVLILCSPYMAGVYFLILITAFCKQKNTGSIWKKNYIQVIRWSGYCSILLFAILIVGLVSRGESWKTYIECIRIILADPDHPSASILQRIIMCFSELVNKNRLYSAIIGLSIVCSFYRKRTRKIRLLLFVICVCGYLYAEYCYLNNEVYVKFNQQMIDIALLGLAAFALLEDKPWYLFFSFTVMGLIYTFMNYLASNTGIYSIGMTLSVCGVGSIVYFVKLCKEIEKQYSGRRQLHFLMVLICIGIITVQLSSELFSRIVRQYWDEEPAALTETIQVGAAKGLKTTLERKQEYERQYGELKILLDSVEEKQNIRFVSFTAAPIVYLDADLKFGTFTAWNFSYKDNYMSYLKKYGELIHHSEESIYYIGKQEDLPVSFPFEQYQMLREGESAVFVPDEFLTGS